MFSSPQTGVDSPVTDFARKLRSNVLEVHPIRMLASTATPRETLQEEFLVSQEFDGAFEPLAVVSGVQIQQTGDAGDEFSRVHRLDQMHLIARHECPLAVFCASISGKSDRHCVCSKL